MSESYCNDTGILHPYCPCEDCVESGAYSHPEPPPTQPSLPGIYGGACFGYLAGCSCDVCKARQFIERLPPEPESPVIPEVCKEAYYGLDCDCPRPHRKKRR